MIDKSNWPRLRVAAEPGNIEDFIESHEPTERGGWLPASGWHEVGDVDSPAAGCHFCGRLAHEGLLTLIGHPLVENNARACRPCALIKCGAPEQAIAFAEYLTSGENEIYLYRERANDVKNWTVSEPGLLVIVPDEHTRITVMRDEDDAWHWKVECRGETREFPNEPQATIEEALDVAICWWARDNDSHLAQLRPDPVVMR